MQTALCSIPSHFSKVETMIIKTKYDVGHEFYVPRVFKTYTNDVITQRDRYGITREYVCNIETLEATVKHKFVSRIEINLRKSGIEVIYWCKTHNQDGLATRFTEDELSITSAEVALQFAKKWRDEEQCEYFGQTNCSEMDDE